MREIASIALGGALGAVSRYAASTFTHRLLGTAFPYGTLLVNVLGCLIIGFIMHLSMSTDLLPRTVRIAATIGFLGAFTTFSTFGWETLQYIEDGAWIPALLNAAANLILCLAAVWTGVMLARTFVGAS
jgi:fluoride exporter